jgi:hypothetical protein
MAIEYIDDNTAKIPELRPNRDLINLRETFGVNPQFLLSDSNPYYTNMNDDIPEEGIASINTDLPIYVKDGNDNNFFQYSNMDGAPGYIRPTEIDQPVSNNIKLASLNPSKDLDSYLDLEAYNEALSKAGMIDNEMFIKDRPIKEAEKTGILKSIKDKGFDILDFIKGGGLSGLLAKTFLGEQDPRATFLRDYYGGEDGSNLTSTGSIASGLMAGYNPVSGSNFLNKISGGIFPGRTFGLQNAYDKRIATIMKTLARKYGDPNYKGTDTKLDERLEKLREEKRKEKEALNTSIARRQNPNVYREAENRGFTNDQGGFSTSKADKAGTSVGSGQFSPKTSQGRSGY